MKVDIPCGNGTEVYAIQAGYVVFATTAGYGMKYVVLGHGEKLSSNPDTYQYYTHYFHLSRWESGLDRGVHVSKGQKIGLSGDTGCSGSYHLDFGFDTGGTSSAAWDSNRRVLPARYLFPGVSDWNGSYDLDFAQPPQSAYNKNHGTYIDINVYPKGTSDSQTLTVTLKYREPGETIWTNSTMSKVGTSSVYRGYFGSSVWNKTVQYHVTIARNGISGYITRPVEKYAAVPSYFYQVYVSPPTNPKAPQD